MSTLKEYYNTGDDSNSFYLADSLPARMICQTFTTTSAYTAQSVKLKVRRIGNLGTIYISIRATSGGAPTGGNLAVCTYDGDSLPGSATWVEFVFASSVSLSSGVKYAIILYAPNITTSNGADSSRLIWRQDIANGTYANGQPGYQNERVDPWLVPGRPAFPDDDTMFELWGVGSGDLTVTTEACTGTIAEKSIGWGTITVFGTSAVTQHGHCWGLAANPTTSGSKTELGAAPNLGTFYSRMTGLVPGTTYYVRAYATDSSITAYGADVTIVTTGIIGRRYVWSELTGWHYFDEYGVERVLEGVTVTSAADILAWLMGT